MRPGTRPVFETEDAKERARALPKSGRPVAGALTIPLVCGLRAARVTAKDPAHERNKIAAQIRSPEWSIVVPVGGFSVIRAGDHRSRLDDDLEKAELRMYSGIDRNCTIG